MYGCGITSKEVYGGHSLGRDDIHAMENESLKKQLEEKEKIIQKLLGNENLRGHGPPNLTNVSSPSTSRNSAPAQSTQPSNTNSLPLQVGAKVLLKGIITSDIVAKGFVESLNPSKLVGNDEIGPHLCEVKVIVAIKFEEPLVRSMGSVKVVEHAIGSSIAWPKHLVQVEEAR